jgi:AcrR family transcriptional regulator
MTEKRKKQAAGPAKKAPAAPRRKRRSSEEILERSINAAAEEFRRSGFAGTTTAAIAQRADVTEAQLFRYFRSKTHLFNEAIFKPLSEHVVQFSETHLTETYTQSNFREAARLYIGELQNFIDSNAEMLMSLLVAQTYPPGDAQGGAEFDSLQAYFERAAAMMSQREDRHPAVDPRLMVRVSFAAIMGGILFKRFVFPQGLASDKEINTAIVDFVMDGISVNPAADSESPAAAGRGRTARRRGATK